MGIFDGWDPVAIVRAGVVTMHRYAPTVDGKYYDADEAWH